MDLDALGMDLGVLGVVLGELAVDLAVDLDALPVWEWIWGRSGSSRNGSGAGLLALGAALRSGN